MDFHSLPRKDLQFFCKKNKIPANMTNIAMADALKALEIVEGIDEFVNQSRDQSPTSVAKNMPSVARTAARTTRRRTTKDEETQQSELVTRSCLVMNKSLDMDQENRNTDVIQNMKLETNVSETPVARSTRRSQVAATSKKDESVQRVYSTRRSVRLLEQSMADLCLKKEVAEREVSQADDTSVKTKEAEVVSVRDLNFSLENEWDASKDDPELESNKFLASDSFVKVEEEEEEETSLEDDFVVVDHACNKESEFEQVKKDSESESEKTESETDPFEDHDSGVVVDTNKEAFVSEVSASDNVSKVDSVATVLIADETKELDSDSDGWSSDFEIDSFRSEELIRSESEETPVSDKKTPVVSSSALAGKETETRFESEEAPVSESDKNKENVGEEMVLNNNGEKRSEDEAMKTEKKKKKIIDEESFKDISMRQLTKMVKELEIKSKQQANNTSALE